MGYKVIFEDNHLLALHKPPGVLVHSDETKDDTLLEWGKKYLKAKYNKPGDVFLNPVHRIDRPASGCVVFARTSKALSRMNQLIKDREIEKKYVCICTGDLLKDRGTLRHLLKKDTNLNKTEVKNDPGGKKLPGGWKRSELDYELIGSSGNRHLYLIRLKTGRSHQVRAQMSKVGSPILGDVKYKGEKWPNPRAIALHCGEMNFIHPVRKEALKIACWPEDQGWDYFQPLVRDHIIL